MCFWPVQLVLYMSSVYEFWPFLYDYIHSCCVYALGVSNGACLRRSVDLRKNTPLGFWSVQLMYLAKLCYFQLGVANARDCGASPTQEKTCPGSWERAPCIFCCFFTLLACCTQPACLLRFADLRKTRPWIVEHVSCVCFDLRIICR